jgi:hypothetical protein
MKKTSIELHQRQVCNCFPVMIVDDDIPVFDSMQPVPLCRTARNGSINSLEGGDKGSVAKVCEHGHGRGKPDRETCHGKGRQRKDC